MVLALYRMCIFCFQICNRLVELTKSGDAGIFPVYYSLKSSLLDHRPVIKFFGWRLLHCK